MPGYFVGGPFNGLPYVSNVAYARQAENWSGSVGRNGGQAPAAAPSAPKLIPINQSNRESYENTLKTHVPSPQPVYYVHPTISRLGNIYDASTSRAQAVVDFYRVQEAKYGPGMMSEEEYKNMIARVAG